MRYSVSLKYLAAANHAEECCLRGFVWLTAGREMVNFSFANFDSLLKRRCFYLGMPLRPALHPLVILRILCTEKIPFQLRSPIRTLVQVPPTRFKLLHPHFQFVPIPTLPVLSDSADRLGGVCRVPWGVVSVTDGVFSQGVETVHVVVD